MWSVNKRVYRYTKVNSDLTEGAMLAQNKSGWKLIKYIDIKEEDIGQYHNVTGRY